jgi:hypothetical protein
MMNSKKASLLNNKSVSSQKWKTNSYNREKNKYVYIHLINMQVQNKLNSYPC